jgi:hypothetical protein
LLALTEYEKLKDIIVQERFIFPTDAEKTSGRGLGNKKDIIMSSEVLKTPSSVASYYVRCTAAVLDLILKYYIKTERDKQSDRWQEIQDLSVASQNFYNPVNPETEFVAPVTERINYFRLIGGVGLNRTQLEELRNRINITIHMFFREQWKTVQVGGLRYKILTPIDLEWVAEDNYFHERDRLPKEHSHYVVRFTVWGYYVHVGFRIHNQGFEGDAAQAILKQEPLPDDAIAWEKVMHSIYFGRRPVLQESWHINTIKPEWGYLSRKLKTFAPNLEIWLQRNPEVFITSDDRAVMRTENILAFSHFILRQSKRLLTACLSY